MAMNGNVILIVVDGTPVAGCKTHKVQTKAETIEKASETQQRWREFIPGRSEWGINTNYLVTAVADIRKVLSVGQTVTIVVCDRQNQASLTGQAIITACEQSYACGSLSVGSYSFKGTGALV